jgi:hypothetical protein
MERFPHYHISARFRMSNSGRALWKLPEMSTESEGANVGSIRARFSLSSASGSPTTVTAYFGCDGSTLSGAEMELMSPAYRTSLVKRRFVAGSVHHLYLLSLCDLKVKCTQSQFGSPCQFFSLSRQVSLRCRCRCQKPLCRSSGPHVD